MVYLCGPAAQLLLAGLIYAAYSEFVAAQIFDDAVEGMTTDRLAPMHVEHLIGSLLPWMMLISINVGWPLFNLIPVPPLDGGMILQELIRNSRDGGRKPWEKDPDWWR